MRVDGERKQLRKPSQRHEGVRISWPLLVTSISVAVAASASHGLVPAVVTARDKAVYCDLVSRKHLMRI